MLKHIKIKLWNGDYFEFPYCKVTKLKHVVRVTSRAYESTKFFDYVFSWDEIKKFEEVGDSYGSNSV